MQLKKYNDFYYTYIRQGNDKNGNAIYIVNIFKNDININYHTNKRLDKHGSIKIQSCNIESDIECMIDKMEV